MKSYQIVACTYDKQAWITRIFAHIFNEYGQDETVHILCESVPQFPLPSNFVYHVINVDNKMWPKDLWSTGILRYLQGVEQENVLIMMCDYFLTRGVDWRGIETLSDYMVEYSDILRIDLTDDRLNARGDPRSATDEFSIGHYDIISAANTSYEMSLQAGLFSVRQLSRILAEPRSPWQIELETQHIIDHYGMKVYGTRQIPMKYINALGTGIPEGVMRLRGVAPRVIERIMNQRWIPSNYTIHGE